MACNTQATQASGLAVATCCTAVRLTNDEQHNDDHSDEQGNDTLEAGAALV